MRERTVLYGGEVILEFDRVKHIYFANTERVEHASAILGTINKPAVKQWAVNQAILCIQSNLKAGRAYEAITIREILAAARYAHGSEQLLVILSEVFVRGASIIGIEELEANLDEKNQRILYDLIEEIVDRNDGIGQALVTSHSNFFGRSIGKDEKLYVHKGSDGKSVVRAWNADAQKALFPTDYKYEREMRPVRKKKKK